MNNSQEQSETDHAETSNDSDDESEILDEEIKVESSEVVFLKDYF